MTGVWLAGIGMVPFGRSDQGVTRLGALAARLALRDSGLAPGLIGQAIVANALAGRLEGASTLGQGMMGELGIEGIPVFNVENACSSGSTAAHLAVQAIRAGAASAVLAVGAERMMVPQMGLVNSGATDPETLLGRVTPAGFALRAQRHALEFGTTPAQLAAVAVKNRRHAQHNPFAIFRNPVTPDEVLASPAIADPLTRLMCCPIADGAAAALFVDDRLARRLGLTIRVAASALTSGRRDSRRDLARWSTDTRTARMAYDQASLGPADLDLVECHDAFTIAEILHCEGLGLCPVGEGGAFVAGGEASLGGRCPVNPSGGLLGRGHPVAATGLAQLAEIALQLQGGAGARQIEGARIGLAHCMGGDGEGDAKSCTILILTTDRSSPAQTSAAKRITGRTPPKARTTSKPRR
ncbi:MAG: thiolase family protein [Rhodospirillales bacterium]|nr:thiolase family protein [Rhodospirillales bacterium]